MAESVQEVIGHNAELQEMITSGEYDGLRIARKADRLFHISFPIPDSMKHAQVTVEMDDEFRITTNARQFIGETPVRQSEYALTTNGLGQPLHELTMQLDGDYQLTPQNQLLLERVSKAMHLFTVAYRPMRREVFAHEIKEHGIYLENNLDPDEEKVSKADETHRTRRNLGINYIMIDDAFRRHLESFGSGSTDPLPAQT